MFGSSLYGPDRAATSLSFKFRVRHIAASLRVYGLYARPPSPVTITGPPARMISVSQCGGAAASGPGGGAQLTGRQ